MPYNAGTAYLQVIPSFRDIEKNIVKDLNKIARNFGVELEKSIPKAFSDALGKAAKDTEKDVGKAAEQIARARAATLGKVLDQADQEQTKRTAASVEKQGDLYEGLATLRRRIAEKELKAFDRRQADYTRLFDQAEDQNTRTAAKAEQDRAKIAEGRAKVFATAAAARERALAKLATDRLREQERAERELEKAHEDAFREQQRRDQQRLVQLRKESDEQAKIALAAARAAEQEAARQFGKSTAGKAQAGVRSGAEAIQEIQVHLNEQNVYGEMQRIRERIRALGDLEIGVDIDVEEFASNVERQFNQLRAIAHDFSVDIDVRTDAAGAATELGGVLVLLNRIDGQDATVDVNVNTESARARLVSFAQSLEVNFSRLGNLIALGASLGSVIVPAAAAATAAIGAIGTAAIGAGAGIGVLLLGFGGVGEAVKALSAAADDEDKTNKSLVNSSNQVANAIDGVKSARRSLANTIANNRDAAIKADEAVADAARALAKARRDADREAEESARKLAKARRDAARDEEEALRKVADARERAAQDAADASRRVQDAQRDLTRDEKTAKETREELTQAYKDAQKSLEDLASEMKHNSIDQQQALLDIALAKEELDRLIANPRATDAEREQARINYEKRKLELQDLSDGQRQLAQEYEDYTKDGLQGSKEVIDAQEKIRQAEQRVADSRRDLAEAQKAQTKALLDGQRSIADAIRDQQEGQQRSAETIANAVRAQQEQQVRSAETIANAERRLASERRDRESQQRQAAFALAGAQQGLIQAQRTLAGAYVSAGAAGGAALDNVNTALGKLSPTAQRFAKFIFGLRDEFYDLRAAASDGLLSGLQTAIESLLPYLPAIKDFVRRVGNKLGELFVDFADSLKDPVFVEFFDYVDKTAVPALDDLYTISTNLLEGFLGLFLGFTPLSDDMTGGLVGMSEAFKDWATTLEDNEGFQTFLQYIRDNGPLVANFFGSLIIFGTKLIEAMAPLGPVILTVLDVFVDFLASLPPDVLSALVAGVAGLAAALGILSAATGIAAISTTALAIAGVVAGLAAYIAGIVLLFKRVTPLRDFFKDLWKAVSDGFTSLWMQVRPILVSLGDSALILWRGAFLPAFRGIADAAKQWWAIIKPLIQAALAVLGVIGQVIIFLWKNLWAPAFRGMALVITNVIVPIIQFLYNNVIKPAFAAIQLAVNVLTAIWKVGFGAMQIAAKIVGLALTYFYREYVKPFLDKMQPFFDYLKDIWKKYITPAWTFAMGVLSGVFDTLRKNASVPIRFIVETLLNDGILKGYNKLADFFDVEPKNVKIDPPAAGWATGGVVDVLPGYSPGVDNHTFVSPSGGVIGLSGGEGILRPEVTSMVRPWLDDANAAARSGGRRGVQRFLGGFSRGGVVPGGGDGLGDWWNASKKKTGDLWKGLKDKATDVYTGVKDFASDPAGYLKKIAEGLINLVPGKDTKFVNAMLGLPRKFVDTLSNKVKNLFTGANDEGVGSGTPGSAGGLGGSAGMMSILRKVFPNLPLISGFRPGAITATGHPSYHGKNRAVDLPPRMDVFQWLRKNYMNSREIIFSPAGGQQIWNGQPHVFSGITKQMHYNHVHWAYDQGGWLPDTREMPNQMMSVFHGRRQPDAVLTNEQWTSISRVANQAVNSSGGRGDVYNFDFEHSALTADRLSAIQTRRDTLDRVARPNR